MCCPTCAKFPCTMVTTLRIHSLRHGGLPSPHYHLCNTAEPCDFDCTPCGKLLKELPHEPNFRFHFGCCHLCMGYKSCQDFVQRHVQWAQKISATPAAAKDSAAPATAPAASTVPEQVEATLPQVAEKSEASPAPSPSAIAKPQSTEPKVEAAPSEPAPAHAASAVASERAPERILVGPLPEPPRAVQHRPEPSHQPPPAELAPPDARVEVKCKRCGSVYRVLARKAGKRGRCPTCGGLIEVPLITPTAAALPQVSSWEHRIIYLAPAAVFVILLVAIGLALSRRGDKGAPAPTPSSADSSAVNKLIEIELQLREVGELVNSVRAYERLVARERRLRAREILTKIRRYDPVSEKEYQLRNEVLQEQEKARAAPGATAEDWQLDTPLSSAEEAELNQLTQEIEQRRRAIEQTLRRQGLVPSLTPDALGRNVLDTKELFSALATHEKELQSRYEAEKQAADADRSKRR